MKKYKVVLFDLDHTLWDYETNSFETLTDLHSLHQLDRYAGLSAEAFVKHFHRVNFNLWDSYNKGNIDRNYIKNNRFQKILKKSGIEDATLAEKLSNQYISTCQRKTNLMPFAVEILDNLKKKYPLFILTNGFDDVQFTKLKYSGLSQYFEGMVTSETCGFRKPAREIFEHTLKKANAQSDETLMVGDNLSTDVWGAQNAGIDAVYYNPHKQSHKQEPSYEISCLKELVTIL